MTIALEIENLACVRGQRVLFRDLCLSLGSGDMLLVEGPNGAGKTSLLRQIAGLLRLAAGSIRLQTSDGPVGDAEERGRFVGWLGHHDAVKPQMGVAEQLAFAAQLFRSRGDVSQAMRRFGLAALGQVPGQYLSAGQKRRVALARLTLCGRPLWLLDEPLAALDAAGKRLVAETVAAHCAAGGIAVAATHEPLGVAGKTLRLGNAS